MEHMEGSKLKNIVGVRFKKIGKIYFFNPKNLKVKKGDKVIVDTVQGQELVTVMIANRAVEDDKIVAPLKKVLRIADKKDIMHYEECKKIEKEAFEVCKKKIKEHNLEMQLTEVECKFDASKILFYFRAEGRIDFRDLVKDLATIYRTRIELRQIGIRDEVKKIGGNGVCGRELCCCSFLSDFDSVTIKMAKEQNISLNPSKISGNCGRLMCCVKYENEVYEEKLAKLPEIGEVVKTPEGEGEVDSIETLKEIVRAKIKDEDGYIYRKYKASEVIRDENRKKVEQPEEDEDLQEIEEATILGGEEDGI